ncbi:hypothetical protein BN1723_015252 [Verticillium longisporum]|uniref:GDS1 winged helix domain-containing protein n=2 Tax=Verticillium longisporum TaxID=100787 RepID=A0A0G4MV05_VERLO|nr:hypothetical protein BN1723_015252 [Verticillium longisporum]
MPYNTRRKSLSLTLLGVHVPVSHAERAAAAAAAAAVAPSTHQNVVEKRSGESKSTTVPSARHANKRAKLSHGKGSCALPLSPTFSMATSFEDNATSKYKHTPPPSPKRSQSRLELDTDNIPSRLIDLEGTDDNVVEAVILQLQATSNRPHLVKELAPILAESLSVVQHSANPCALISARLASYLKRPCWSALAPCPLAKELESSHLRRSYYHLTTCARKPLPPMTALKLRSRVAISPSISSTGSLSGDDDDAHRRELSPSPEVDLSPDFDDMVDDMNVPVTPIGSFSKTFRMPRSIRSASPPLEKDEREFTQTADGLHKRKLSGESLPGCGEHVQADDLARDDLFGDRSYIAAGSTVSMNFIASPAFRATCPPSSTRKDTEDNWLKFGKSLEWDHKPEDIELDELDCLLDAC